MRVAKAVALGVAMLGFTPGASAQVLEDLSPAAIRQQVAPGDAVRAGVKDGRTFELTVVSVEAETLTGTTFENRRFRIRYSALSSLEITGKAAAATTGVVALPGPKDSVRTWFGLNFGLVSGSIDLPCASPGDSDCSEDGTFTSFGANVTVAGPVAARLRAVHGNEDTDKRPLETAILVGPRIAQDFYVMIGASTVHNADDEYPGDADGIAWELVYAPTSLAGAGMEVSLHGATGDDLTYGGISFGMRFGKLR